MMGLFALFGMMIAFIIQSNKKMGYIENKIIRYVHYVLMVFTLFITGLSINIVLQFVFNFEAFVKAVYIEYGFFIPMVNSMVLAITTLLNLSLLFLSFAMVRRSELARKWFVIGVPLLFVVTTIRTLNEAMGQVEIALSSYALVGLVIGLAITYAPMFFFYRNQKVREAIFKDNV